MEEKDKAQQFYDKSRIQKELSREIHPLAMWSFAIGVIPLFFWWILIIPFIGWALSVFIIPLFVFAIIIGIISISKISENQNKFKGTGFAVTGIVLSTIYLLIIIIVFAMFFLF